MLYKLKPLSSKVSQTRPSKITKAVRCRIINGFLSLISPLHKRGLKHGQWPLQLYLVLNFIFMSKPPNTSLRNLAVEIIVSGKFKSHPWFLRNYKCWPH